MKLAAWNVNSLKVRLPHVLDWLAANQPDVLCLQETKQEDKDFPVPALQAAGYAALFAGQKTYNGVAILSKAPGTEAQVGIPGFDDVQQRVLAATVNDVRVVCVYVPNGQSLDSDKYQYKLRWLQALTDWLRAELVKYPRLALLGDYNIAPEDRDVHDPKAWEGQVLCSPAERAAYAGLIGLGMHDAFRLFEQKENSFSWWDYRMAAFRRNMGLRIDHILLSSPLAQQCTACWIDTAPRKLERPSDHAPVVAEVACAGI
ncbi:MAG TPA: exodeoxyribonuclease III [Novimethylophilus sp.]|jgi:exodeoxyribonuclease-3|uniref:exodeoxyribonuclease III n=1 Tax=Novimethylophilus sp. TaxID=2137426 RepID=UPI002F3E6233